MVLVLYYFKCSLFLFSELDLLPFLVTFLLSFWEVQYGIVGGIAVSGFMLLYNIARPKLKVSDDDVLVVALDNGLNFPASEYISNVLYTEALLVSPPRSAILDCHHVNNIDYTVVNEIRDLLRQFDLRGVCLVFSGLSIAVLEVLLAAELPGLRHMDSVDAALQSLSGNKAFN